MKRMAKQLLALMAALMLLVSVVPMAAADELPVFTLGTQEVTVPANAYAQFTFTAPEAGTYNFYSESNCDPKITLFDTEGMMIAYNDDTDEGRDFFLTRSFEKDETVIVAISTFSDDDEVFSVTIDKAPVPTGIEIESDAEQISLALFEERWLGVELTPMGADVSALTISSSDEDVVDVNRGGEGIWMDAYMVGSATVTVAVSETISDSIDVTVRPVLAWDSTKAQSVLFTPDYQAHTFAFTVAEEGYYKLMLAGNDDAYIDLYESTDEPGVFDGIWPEDGAEFEDGEWVIAYFEKGVTYYAHVNGDFWEGKLCDELVMTLEPSDYEPLEEGVRFEQDSATVALGEYFEPLYQVGYEEGEITITAEDEAILEPVDGGFVGAKVGETTLTIESEAGSTDTMTITVVEAPLLELGKRTEVVFGGQYERVYAFTPAEDGTYVFRSYSEKDDTYVNLYDDNWEQLDYNDDDEVSYNFCLQSGLEGGETYYLVFSGYNDNKISYEVDVQKGVPATSVTLGLWDDTYLKQDGKTFYTYVGTEFYPTVKFGDAVGVLEEDYGIEYSDEDFLDDWFVGKAGEMTVTVTTENDLTDTITVIALEYVAGDINLDGELSKDDLTALASYLNGNADFGALRPFADLNADCVVNGYDAALLREWLGITFETGDVNGDGKINTTDARVVLQYAAGIIKEDALTVDAADTNGDGKVNTTDARRILQYAAGIITSF